MKVQIPPNAVVVFDLDDTLYKERDFVRSGFRAVAEQLFPHIQRDVFAEMFAEFERGSNQAFDHILERYPISALSKVDLLSTYRTHQPQLTLPKSSRVVLGKLKERGFTLGLLTDGRAITQRNKLASLGLSEMFDLVVISEELGSEKPAIANYEIFETTYPGQSYLYVADNTVKDFITPNRRGWVTICLRDHGENIHRQDCSAAAEYHAQHIVDDLRELIAP